MTYDPFYHYEEDEKKRKRWDSLLPVFVAAIVLLVGFYGFFVAYQRSHAKPKPEQSRSVREIVGTHWQSSQLPENKQNHLTGWNDGGWLVKEAAVDRPKLHKRKHHQETQRLCDSSGHCEYMAKFHLVPSAYDWSWHILSTVPSEMWCEKPKGAKAVNCDSRPLTPDEIKMYQPFPDSPASIIDLRKPTNGSECVGFKGFHYSEAAHGCLEDGYPCYKDCGADYYMPHFVQCPAGATCTPVEQTSPADITNLMEQIAPTPTQYICRKAGECFPKCDSPLTPSITRACYQVGFRGEKTLVLPSNYAHGFTCPDEFESCWVVNSTIDVPHEHQPIVEWHINPPARPDCKMPADVDVCPDTIDPKAANDSDSKNKARQSLATAMLICAENPNATPSIILKDGPTLVPCATLKWAVDAVEADDKKGKS